MLCYSQRKKKIKMMEKVSKQKDFEEFNFFYSLSSQETDFSIEIFLKQQSLPRRKQKFYISKISHCTYTTKKIKKKSEFIKCRFVRKKTKEILTSTGKTHVKTNK
jgi:hypothetical protein